MLVDGILKNPAFFDKENEKSKYELAGEYFDLCLQYETVHGMAKAHVFKLFRREYAFVICGVAHAC